MYCCSHWVLEFVQGNTDISSIRLDLLPYLIRRQFLSADKIIADIPSIEYRRRPLKSIEPFLVSSAAGRDIVKEFSTSVQQCAMSPISGGLDLRRIDSVGDKLTFNFEGSEDILRCFALVSDDNVPSAKSISTDYVVYERFCQKISSIQLYMNLNRLIKSTIPLFLVIVHYILQPCFTFIELFRFGLLEQAVLLNGIALWDTGKRKTVPSQN